MSKVHTTRRYLSFPNNEIADLAGNSFAGTHVGAVLLAFITMLGPYLPKSTEELGQRTVAAKAMVSALKRATKQKCKAKTHVGKGKTNLGNAKQKCKAMRFLTTENVKGIFSQLRAPKVLFTTKSARGIF